MTKTIFIAAMVSALTAFPALVCAEEAAPKPEPAHATETKAISSSTKKAAAVKKAKASVKKKVVKPAEPVSASPKPQEPSPTTPVSGGGAESPTRGLKLADYEKSSVTVEPLPYVTRKVSALIESTPPSCDIEVDGVYVGATPVELHLKEGTHFMRISRGGYLPWEKTVKAYNGIFIYATLTQESTRKIEINESVKAK